MQQEHGTKEATVKLSRLYQPRNPQFWLLIVLNLLSTGISYILRSRDLPMLVTLVLAAFALANFVIGIRIALQLMSERPDEA
jgi:hypothetical protein